MTITTEQIKAIRQEFARLKPATVTLDGHRAMTIKEAVFVLAPTLERMKKRGFEVQELVEKLHEKGIEAKPPTLAKYLSEFRRQKKKKRDTPPPPPVQPQKPHPCHTWTNSLGLVTENSSLPRTCPWKIYDRIAVYLIERAKRIAFAVNIIVR